MSGINPSYTGCAFCGKENCDCPKSMVNARIPAELLNEVGTMPYDLLLDNFHWSQPPDAEYDLFRAELVRRLRVRDTCPYCLDGDTPVWRIDTMQWVHPPVNGVGIRECKRMKTFAESGED